MVTLEHYLFRSVLLFLFVLLGKAALHLHCIYTNDRLYQCSSSSSPARLGHKHARISTLYFGNYTPRSHFGCQYPNKYCALLSPRSAAFLELVVLTFYLLWLVRRVIMGGPPSLLKQSKSMTCSPNVISGTCNVTEQPFWKCHSS